MILSKIINCTIYYKNITNDTIWIINWLILISNNNSESLSLRLFLISKNSIYFITVFITDNFRFLFGDFRNNGCENNFQIKKGESSSMETYFYIDREYNDEFYYLFYSLFCRYRRQLEFGCIVKIKQNWNR